MQQQQHAQQQQHTQQQQHLQQHAQDAAEQSAPKQPTELKHVELPKQHKPANEVQGGTGFPDKLAYAYEEEEEDEDEEEEDEEASFILGNLARENLFRHNISTCSSDPE